MIFEENLSREISAKIMGTETTLGGGFSSSKVPYHLTILSIVDYDQRFKNLLLKKCGEDVPEHDLIIDLLDYSTSKIRKEIEKYSKFGTSPFNKKLTLLEMKTITGCSVNRIINNALNDKGDSFWKDKFNVSIVKYKDKYRSTFEHLTYLMREELHQLVKLCNERKEQEMIINSRLRVV